MGSEVEDCPLEADKLVLDVGYSVDGSVIIFDEPSPGTVGQTVESFLDLGSNDFEIDISPENTQYIEPDMTRNKELETRVEDLQADNEELLKKVASMEEQLKTLASNKASLPTLYHQFIESKQQVAELEKKNQELAAENVDLSLRVDRKDSVGPIPDSEEDKHAQELRGECPQLPLKRSQTFLASTPAQQGTVQRSHTLPMHQLLQKEDAEATKLEMAEKIVQQEEEMLKLRKERDVCLKRLNELEAGVDGLEDRFERMLCNHQTDITQNFKTLRTALHAIQEGEKATGGDMAALRGEMKKILESFPHEMQKLKERFQKSQAEQRKEKEELEERLENKSMNLDEAKKQIMTLSDEAEQREATIHELEAAIEVRESKIASMKTQRLIPGGVHQTASTSEEFDAMRNRIDQLEKSLSQQQTMYETLLREKDEAEEAMFSISAVKEDATFEEIEKENTELRNELMEVSERLVDMEEENDALKVDIENQSDFFEQCLSLEEELEAQRRVNRGLEEHLIRRQRRIDGLQSELGNLRQHLSDVERGPGHRRRIQETKTAVSNQVDEMLHQERRYEELDRILSGVQDERDELLQSKAHLNKMMHSLIKENKVATRALNKLRREGPIMDEKLAEARAEVVKLQARLKVETLARQHSGKSHALSEVDEDIMSKLVSSQIALAEMDERMSRVRKELHKAVARNAFLATKASRLEKQLRAA